MTIILDKSSRTLAAGGAAAASTVNEERRRGKTIGRSQERRCFVLVLNHRTNSG